MALRGITSYELLGLPPGGDTFLPDAVRQFLDGLSVHQLESVTTGRAYMHRGTVRSPSTNEVAVSGGHMLEIPGLNTGLPFQLLMRRRPPAPGDDQLEPPPDSYQLDLMIDRASIRTGLRPAKLVPAQTSPLRAAHLEPDPARKDVRLVGAGVLRIMVTPAGADVRFIDLPDPLDGDTPTGPVFRLAFSPPHFFLRDYGLTVDHFVYDASPDYTPPEVAEFGQSDNWQGLFVGEAVVYPPAAPFVQNLSIGVRNALFGSPIGMQGEVDIGWGTDVLATPVLLIEFQPAAGGPVQRVSCQTGSRAVSVPLPSAPADGGWRARVILEDPAALGSWWLPGQPAYSSKGEPPPSEKGRSTSFFGVTPGALLRLQPWQPPELPPANPPKPPTKYPDIVVYFAAPPVAPTEPPLPTFRVTQRRPDGSRQSFDDVVHVSGDRDALDGLEIEAAGATGDQLSRVVFQVGSDRTPIQGWHLVLGSSTAGLPPPEQPVARKALGVGGGAAWDVVLLDPAKQARRRMRVEWLEAGNLVVGTSSGVATLAGPVAPRATANAYRLEPFSQKGDLVPLTESAASALAPPAFPLAQGQLAEVTLELGQCGDPDLPATPSPPAGPNNFTLHMQFAKSELVEGTTESTDFELWVLMMWAAGQSSGLSFLVIGRCDDLGDAWPAPPKIPDTRLNVDLGANRAEYVRTLIEGIQPAAHVLARGEQVAWTADQQAEGQALEAAAEVRSGTAWLIRTDNPDGRTTWHRPPDGQSGVAFADDIPRPAFRRVDVFAVFATPPAEPPPQAEDDAKLDPCLRRALVQGAEAPMAVPLPPRDGTLPCTGSLVLKWDSPTLVRWSDAVPTLAELKFSWQEHNVPLRDPDGRPLRLGGQQVADATLPALTLTIRWVQDVRTGELTASVGVVRTGSPEGLIPLIAGPRGELRTDTTARLVSAGLALGPALASGLEGAGVSGAAVRASALLAASVAAGVFASTGRVIIQGVTAEYRRSVNAEGPFRSVRLLFDYTVDIGFDTGVVADLRTDPEHPMRVRYKNVGVEITDRPDGIDDVDLVYEEAAFSVEDPGRWTIGGPLGRLLRVTAARVGTGTTWAEVDLAFALDLGIVKVSEATVRLTFDGPSIGVELRGLEATVSIPKVLKGSGRLAVQPDGAVSAALDVMVLPDAPSALRAKGTLQWAQVQDPAGNPTTFTQLGIAVTFSTPLPLAGTGLGVYGLAGRFVANGQRLLPAIDDPVQRELGWYRAPDAQKYTARAGQWAIGLGAVIGSLSDGGFSFNAAGMLAVAFPDPSVVFGISASFLRKPELPASENGSGRTSMNMIGLVAIDDTAVTFAVFAQYEQSGLISLKVPVGGYFPYSGNYYVHVGSDGKGGRTGEPVVVTLLPHSLNCQAKFFLMIESGGISDLGGLSDLGLEPIDLQGFAVGAGLSFTLDWDATVVRVRGSAMLAAGFGSHPFTVAGLAMARGELSILGVGVALEGLVQFLVRDDAHYVHAEICGELDTWFGSIRRCVRKTYATGPSPLDTPPPDPITGCDLTDFRTHVTAPAAVAAAEPPVVWPDTIPVLHFAHYAGVALTGTNFSIAEPLPASAWSGSEDLKYAFRLTTLSLRKADGTPVSGPLPTVWTLPPAGTTAGSPQARDLELLTWEPARWARSLGDGGATAPGDPAAALGAACEQVPAATPACALGYQGRRKGLGRLEFRAGPVTADGFASQFRLPATEELGALGCAELIDLATESGMCYVPGRAEAFARPYQIPDRALAISGVWRLSTLQAHSVFAASLGLSATFAPVVTAPVVYLAVSRTMGRRCDTYSDIPLGTWLPKQTYYHRGFGYTADIDLEAVQVVSLAPGSGPDALPELQFQFVAVRLPALAQEVALDLATLSEPVDVTVLNDRGQEVGRAVFTGAPRQLSTLTVQGPGIRTVHLQVRFRAGANRSALLQQICMYSFSCEDLDRSILGAEFDALELTGIGAPAVRFDLARGGTGTVPGTKIGTLPAPIGADVYRYAVQGNIWRGLHIPAMRVHRAWLLAVCATDMETLGRREQERRWHQAIVSGWNRTSARPRTLLDPATTYEVVARCAFARWNAGAAEAPPPLDQAQWTELPEQVFRFRTAATSFDRPYSGQDETTFDPRWIRRYLDGFEPDGNGAPHFTADPVRAWFSVNYIDPLLRTYRHKLLLKVRRTDPPPGGGQPAVTAGMQWSPLPQRLLDLADARLLAAAAAAPCLNDSAPLGGSAVSASVQLEPGARYDAILVAPPLGVPDGDPASEDLVVARTQFLTSRYRSPAELLGALGFATDGTRPGPIPPLDLFVTAQLPPDSLPGDDLALERALRDLGLDPLAPPRDGAQVFALWQATSWNLAGLLIDCDEPLDRGDRLRIGAASLDSTPLLLLRCNATASRVLFAPQSGPVQVPAGARLVLRLNSTEPPADIVGYRSIGVGPLMVSREGA